MRSTRLVVVAVVVVVAATAFAAVRPAPARAASTCSVTNGGPLVVLGSAYAGVDLTVFCNDGVGWRVSVEPEYEMGTIWTDFNTSVSGADASRQLPNEACAAKDHYTNDSRHDIEVTYNPNETCNMSSDQLFVSQALTPNACNKTTERVEYTFRNAANGHILRQLAIGPSSPTCES